MVTFPLDIKIGSFFLPIHLVTDILAFFIAFKYYIYLRNKKDDFIKSEIRWHLIIAAAIGALIFSRLLAALENPALFFNPPSFLFYIQGKTIVGGLIGGIIGVEVAKKLIKEKRSTGDLFTYPIILGMIIGRIGCLLTGVSDKTVGIASNMPWAFDQGDGIPRHPASLYEIIFLILIWIFISKLEKKFELKNGVKFKIFVASYLLFRVAIEFIKPVTPLMLGLSAIQMASLIGAAYFIWRIYSKGAVKR